MFATLAECKSILNITDTTYDVRMTQQLPIIRQRIVDLCNKDFRFQNTYLNRTSNVYYTFNGKQVSVSSYFTYAKTAQTITCTNDDIDLRLYIQAPSDLLIEGTVLNNGYVSVKTVAEHVITTEAGQFFYDEVAPLSSMVLVNFPITMKDVVAEMLFYDVVRPKGNAGISSESIGGYSASYRGDTGRFGYPVEIISKLNPYKILRVI